MSATQTVGETLILGGQNLHVAVVALIIGIVVAVGLIILIIRDISRDGD